MIHVHKSGKHFHATFLTVLLIGVFSLLSSSCNSPESPDTEEPEAVATLTVTNDYGEILDVYLDGEFQFVLGDQESKVIEDISQATHRLEAKKVGTSEVVDWYDFEITEINDYTWVIDDPPDINVINSSGIKLKIFMDGVYQFDIADEENRWILDVSRAEHYLRADRVEDGTEYASTTINVIRNADYTWGID